MRDSRAGSNLVFSGLKTTLECTRQAESHLERSRPATGAIWTNVKASRILWKSGPNSKLHLGNFPHLKILMFFVWKTLKWTIKGGDGGSVPGWGYLVIMLPKHLEILLSNRNKICWYYLLNFSTFHLPRSTSKCPSFISCKRRPVGVLGRDQAKGRTTLNNNITCPGATLGKALPALLDLLTRLLQPLSQSSPPHWLRVKSRIPSL